AAVDHVLLQAAVGPFFTEPRHHRGRPGEKQRRNPAGRPERLPDRDGRHHGDAAEDESLVPLVEIALHGFSSTTCQIASSIWKKRGSRLSLRGRGRSNGMVNTPLTRPGRPLITATRSAR